MEVTIIIKQKFKRLEEEFQQEQKKRMRQAGVGGYGLTINKCSLFQAAEVGGGL